MSVAGGKVMIFLPYSTGASERVRMERKRAECVQLLYSRSSIVWFRDRKSAVL